MRRPRDSTRARRRTTPRCSHSTRRMRRPAWGSPGRAPPWAMTVTPGRPASPQVRIEAVARLQSAQEQPSPGPTLRAQIARLSALLPEFDQPVHLSLISDSVTRVAIPSVGAFGAFARRDIELKPGHYTVIGTRDGYRDVRRDITVNPGQQTQTVNISCSEPI